MSASPLVGQPPRLSPDHVWAAEKRIAQGSAHNSPAPVFIRSHFNTETTDVSHQVKPGAAWLRDVSGATTRSPRNVTTRPISPGQDLTERRMGLPGTRGRGP